MKKYYWKICFSCHENGKVADGSEVVSAETAVLALEEFWKVAAGWKEFSDIFVTGMCLKDMEFYYDRKKGEA